MKKNKKKNKQTDITKNSREQIRKVINEPQHNKKTCKKSTYRQARRHTMKLKQDKLYRIKYKHT